MKKIYFIGGVFIVIIVIIIIILINKNRNKIESKIQTKSMDLDSNKALGDLSSEKKIMLLHPLIRGKARDFINKAETEGINLRVTSTLRTYAEQNKLYEQGRTTAGGIVTNARGGYSNHNFGLAFDVVPIVNGKADWNTKDWNKIGQIGKSVGFEWGGDWKSFVDKPHFQMLFNKSLAQLRSLYKDNGDYVEIA